LRGNLSHGRVTDGFARQVFAGAGVSSANDNGALAVRPASQAATADAAARPHRANPPRNRAPAEALF
jgi:hypothetical protein